MPNPPISTPPQPSGNSQNQQSNVVAPIGVRIQELSDAIQVAKTEIRNASYWLLLQIALWLLICLAILIASGCFISNHLWDLTNNPYFNKEWTWPVIYFTAIRIVVLTAIFAIATFCFKMLKSYIHMFQYNRQKQVLINSMPSLVHAAEEKNRKIVYNKILDMLIHLGATGIIENDIGLSSQSSILDMVGKLKK